MRIPKSLQDALREVELCHNTTKPRRTIWLAQKQFEHNERCTTRNKRPEKKHRELKMSKSIEIEPNAIEIDRPGQSKQNKKQLKQSEPIVTHHQTSTNIYNNPPNAAEMYQNASKFTQTDPTYHKYI